MKPNKPNKKVLLAVSGMSPQIITETLYGLVHAQDNPWLPDEIHLITTQQGKEQARLQLLEGSAWYSRFLHDYHVQPSPRFTPDTIHVIRDPSGNVLADIKTPADNEAAADFITETIRHFTSDDTTELHVSIAGGRKTMGFYAGYALSMYGRAQDRLSHVLVSGEYESLRDFFYPAPETRVVYKRVGDKEIPLDASQAEVWLADIPFIRLRSFLTQSELLSQHRFSEAVTRIAMATQPLYLEIDEIGRTLRVNHVECRLSPAHFAFYQMFVIRQLKGLPGLYAPAKGTHCPLIAAEFLEQLRIIKGEASRSYQNTAKSMAEGMELDYFSPALSKINQQLRTTFGPDILKKIGIHKYPDKRGPCYHIRLPAAQITMDDLGDTCP